MINYKKYYSNYSCPICGKLVCKYYGSPKSIKKLVTHLTRNRIKREIRSSYDN